MVTDFVGRVDELARINRLAAERSRGVVLAGPTGIGKSRLAREALSILMKTGAETFRAQGSETAAGIPFSAVAGWIPEQQPGDGPLDILLSTQRAMLSRARGKPPAVCVDDAHLVDASSAALIARLTTSDAAFVILTIDDTAAINGPIEAIMRDDRVPTIRLSPLSGDAVESLATAQLRAPLDALSMACLKRLGEGNPLYVNQLIAEARRSGTLVMREGLWSLSVAPRVGAHLEALMRRKLAGVSEAETAVLELVSIGEPIGLDLLEALVDLAHIESLEAANVITLTRDGRRSVVRVASPLMAAAIRGWIPSTRFRRLGGTLATERSRGRSRRTEDRLDIARWSLVSGRDSNPEVMVEAARLALANFDSTLGERLARTAVDSGGGFDANLELARALALQGRLAEAEELLAQTASRAKTEAELARTALLRIRNLGQLGTDPDTALRVGMETIDQIEDAGWKDEVASELALYAAHIGDYARALAVGAGVVDRSTSRPSIAVRRLLVSSISHLMVGELASSDDACKRGLQIARDVAREMPLAADLFSMNLNHSEVYAGNIGAAVAGCRDGYQQAVEAANIGSAGLWAAHCGFALLMRGDIEGSLRMYGESVAHLRDLDPIGALTLTQCWRAYAHVQGGDAERGEQIVRDVDVTYTPTEHRIRAVMDRVRAWGMLASNDTELAAKVVIEAGEHLIEKSHVVWGLLTIHDAVRMGRPDLALTRLEESAGRVEGDLAPALARHAHALADGDGHALDACAVDFERIGAMLLAAETSGQAAKTHNANGDRLHAARAASVARLLAQQCPGARTPALRGEIRFLTDREFQVAVAAAQGRTNREVAEQLHISRRTVENHLGSVYAKLGIVGRTGLAEILAAALSSGV